MSVEEALEILKKYAKELTAIGDAKQFVKTNPAEFIDKVMKVSQYYKYIEERAATFDENGPNKIWEESLDVVGDIGYNNPSLDDWVYSILGIEKLEEKEDEKKETKTEKKESVEEALEKLKKYAKELTAIGDAKQFIKTNPAEFIEKVMKVLQYYKYIEERAATFDENGPNKIWEESLDVVGDIGYDNPSLDDWVYSILGIEKVEEKEEEKKETKTEKKEMGIDPLSLSNKIYSYVNEVKNASYWDTNTIGDIEWNLKNLQQILIENKSSFEESLYNCIMNDINAALYQINNVKKMMDMHPDIMGRLGRL